MRSESLGRGCLGEIVIADSRTDPIVEGVVVRVLSLPPQPDATIASVVAATAAHRHFTNSTLPAQTNLGLEPSDDAGRAAAGSTALVRRVHGRTPA